MGGECAGELEGLMPVQHVPPHLQRGHRPTATEEQVLRGGTQRVLENITSKRLIGPWLLGKSIIF